MRQGEDLSFYGSDKLICNLQPDVQKNERDYLNGGLTPLMVAVKHKHVEATRKMVKFR